MTKEQLNQMAIDEFQNLTDNKYFEILKEVEQQIKDNKEKMYIPFYMEMQDTLTYINGEIENSFGELNAELEKYIVGRKLSITIEAYENKDVFTVTDKKTKLSSSIRNSILSSLIRAEVDDLFKTVLLLESKLKRVTMAIQTCRNHTGIKKLEREN